MNVLFGSLGMLRTNPAQHAFTATAPASPNVLFGCGQDVVSFGKGDDKPSVPQNGPDDTGRPPKR